MVIAMIGMRVMKVALDEIIDVVTMRHRFMAAAAPVLMSGRMPAAAMLRGAGVRMRIVHRDRVLIDVIVVHVMEMSVVQVVDMVAMADGGVAAIGPVLVRMVGVLGIATASHRVSPW